MTKAHHRCARRIGRQAFEINMADKKFLEEYPLYRKFMTNFRYWITLENLPKPAIHMYCNRCESDQTFNMVNKYDEVDYHHDANISDTVVRALYECSACTKSYRWFLLRFWTETITRKNQDGDDVESKVICIEKIGQYPAWSISMDKELERLLGDHSSFYRRGLVCESQGYGIGAFAYYRRIVEEVIGDLLVSIEELLTDLEDKKKYAAALEEVKKTTVTQEKVELVQDLLPISLRPDGINPLSALHSALSEGIHAEDEETCLEYAGAVRDALVFLVNRLVRTKSEDKSFSASIRKLLDKKTEKNQKK